MESRVELAPEACLGCDLVAGRRPSPSGVIAEDEHFHAHQDAGIALPGFVIVAARRHYRRWDEMTAPEAASFAALVPRIRRAQREALGIDEVYYFLQENTRHHFHMWMLPHLAWMDGFGAAPASLPEILRHARETLSGEAHWRSAMDAATRLRHAMRAPANDPGARSA